MIILAAVPDLLTAAAFLLVWLRTDLAGPYWVATGVTTFLLEFFIVHASGFYAVLMYGEGTPARRSLQLGALSLFYFLMIGAFAWGLHAWWMVGAFFWLTLGKLLAVWSPRGSRERGRQQMAAIIAWAASVACYLGAVGASVMVEWPAYGVTPEVIAAAGFSGHGDWEEMPWHALAGGAIYFGVMAVVRTLIRATLLRSGSKDAAAAV